MCFARPHVLASTTIQQAARADARRYTHALTPIIAMLPPVHSTYTKIVRRKAVLKPFHQKLEVRT